VADARHPVAEEHAHERGPHPLEIAALRDRVENSLVREADGGLEAVRRDREVGVVLIGPGDLSVLAGRRDEIRDRVHGDARRHFSRSVSSHPVGDQEEIVLGDDREAVLVVLPLPTDIGEAFVRNLHREFSGAAAEWQDRISASSGCV